MIIQADKFLLTHTAPSSNNYAYDEMGNLVKHLNEKYSGISSNGSIIVNLMNIKPLDGDIPGHTSNNVAK